MKIEKKDIINGIIYSFLMSITPVTLFLIMSLAEGTNRFSSDVFLIFVVLFILAFSIYLLSGNFRKELLDIDKLKALLKNKKDLTKLFIFFIIFFGSFYLYKKQIIEDYIFVLIIIVLIILIFYFAKQSRKKFD